MLYVTRLLIGALLLAVLPVQTAMAQEDAATLTLTQAQINAAVAVAVDNVQVIEALVIDFEDDALVIAATVVTPENGSTDVAIVLTVGTDDDGTVQWEVAAASVNDFALREAQLDAINTAIQQSQPALLRDELNAQVVVSVELDDGEINYNLNPDLPSIDDLPIDLPEDFPTELPEDLPIDLPDDFPTDFQGEPMGGYTPPAVPVVPAVPAPNFEPPASPEPPAGGFGGGNRGGGNRRP